MTDIAREQEIQARIAAWQAHPQYPNGMYPVYWAPRDVDYLLGALHATRTDRDELKILVAQAQGDAAALRAQVGSLRAALEPFAAAAEQWESMHDAMLTSHYGRDRVTVGDLRRARGVLRETEP